MALLASQPHVPAGQRECAEFVIEIGILPIRRFMTGGAIRAILPGMFVILLVAGITVHGRAFVLSVDVTRLTGDLRMRPFQFEDRQVVIELRR